MIDIKLKTNCCGCYSCVMVCPKNCIRMNADSEGFWYPEADSSACIQCGLCEKSCPVLNVPESTAVMNTYAAINNNETQRINSSSGGVFTLLAEEIISQGGIVYGAAFNEDFSVRHIPCSSSDELERLRTSKYTQSVIGDVFRKVQYDLDNNRKVLFTGTPCQAAGLKCFLKKEYSNLYIQDFICHGVPSPKLWEKYLTAVCGGKTPSHVNFRDKSTGWRKYSVLIEQDSVKNTLPFSQNKYMQLFLNNMCLRESCYDCHFKSGKKHSDITLADFWGVWEELPEFYDDKGVSAVLINSPKGMELFRSIGANLSVQEISIDSVIKGNPALVKSCMAHTNRNKYLKLIDKADFDTIYSKSMAFTFADKVKNKLKRMLTEKTNL